MESSDACEGCGLQCVLFDTGTGVFACEACGLVRQDTVLRHVDFDDEGIRTGTYIGGRGTVSALGAGRSAWSFGGSQIGFRSDRGKRYTTAKLDELASLLRLPKDKIEDVQHMLGVITEEKWSARQWMDVLVATCIYIVARKHGLPLSAAEVAATLNCTVKDILGTYQRVRIYLDFQSTPIDPTVHFDKIVSQHLAFKDMKKEDLRRLSRQGHCLLWYGQEWSLAAGRHPMALVAAVVVLVGKANNIKVNLNTLSQELHINPATSRLRLKEYMTSLIGFGQLLPWGKDITFKTVDRHLPFLLQYMETRIKMDSGKVVGTSQEPRKVKEDSTVEDAALRDVAKALYLKYGKTIGAALEKQPFDVVKDEVLDSPSDQETAPIIKKQKVDSDYISGNTVACSQSSEQAKVENDLASSGRVVALAAVDSKSEKGSKTKDHSTWKPLPPSFLANKEATAKRTAKILAAKQRISRVKQAIANQLASEGNKDAVDEKPSHSKNSELNAVTLGADEYKSQDTGLDEEDFLIQYCLIRGAQEDVLEAGYYLHTLSTPPVQPNRDIVSDEELLMYFKTPREIEFLQSFSQGDAVSPWLTTEELELHGL